MTVEQLIKYLEKCPKEAIVVDTFQETIINVIQEVVDGITIVTLGVGQ